MPPKIDPYATPRARTADLLLVLFALLTILIAVLTAPRSHAAPGAAVGSPSASIATEVTR